MGPHEIQRAVRRHVCLRLVGPSRTTSSFGARPRWRETALLWLGGCGFGFRLRIKSTARPSRMGSAGESPGVGIDAAIRIYPGATLHLRELFQTAARLCAHSDPAADRATPIAAAKTLLVPDGDSAGGCAERF